MAPNGITLLPVTASDFPTLVKVDSLAYMDDEFSKVAFGPQKDSPDDLAIHVRGLLKTLQPDPHKTTHHIKALSGDEIVGWATWSFVTPKPTTEEESSEKVDSNEGEVNDGWGTTANVKFCEHVFLTADGWMDDSTHGLPFAKLNSLAVLPSHQRLGIGAYLLSEGLKEVDAKGLQCVLGASPEAAGLYERHGFKEVNTMELKLWEWEGGEGLGLNKHAVMHRAAKGTKSE